MHFEKENVSRTKRPRRCRSVQFHRSMCAVSPVSLPTCVNCSFGMTIWYAFQKSAKQCPLRYSSGILSHNSRHVFSLLSPIARATTCRVFLQRAIHIQTWFTLFKTNDHNSSSSRNVANSSSGSGAINVSLKGGSCAAFFSANLWPCFSIHQMSWLDLACYSALGMILLSLLYVLPYNHWGPDFPDFASCRIYSNIFAFHLAHNHYAPILCFHSIDSTLWLLP